VYEWSTICSERLNAQDAGESVNPRELLARKQYLNLNAAFARTPVKKGTMPEGNDDTFELAQPLVGKTAKECQSVEREA